MLSHPLPDIYQQHHQHSRRSSSLTLVNTRHRNQPQPVPSSKCDHCGNTDHTSTICPRSAYLSKMLALTCAAYILTCRSGNEDSNQI